MMVPFAESGCPIFRATSPLSRGQLWSKWHGKMSRQYVPICKRLRRSLAQVLLWISSVFTEQSHRCAKNTKPFTIERGNPLWEGSHVPHSCQAWSRQKCFWIVMTLLVKIFYCNGERIEKLSQQDKLRKFCMGAGFLTVVEVGQKTWRKTLQNSHNSQMQWPVVSTLCQETKKDLNRKVGSKGISKLCPYWQLQLVSCKVNMELRSELCL